jgi:hypothetical protein
MCVTARLRRAELVVRAILLMHAAPVSRGRKVWDRLCRRLWSTKVYVPQRFVNQLGGNSKEAYRQSLADGRRQTITKEELVQFVWNFRFKEAAGTPCRVHRVRTNAAGVLTASVGAGAR